MRVAKELRRSAVFGEVELFVPLVAAVPPISMRVAKECDALLDMI